MKTLKQFINSHGITMDVEWVDNNPNMNDMPAGSRHFRCTLKCSRRRMVVHFSQGPAIEREPTAENVLDCIASDSSSVLGSKFEDWCSDMGWDADSRKAEKTYLVCVKQSNALQRLLGDNDAFEALLYRTERL